MRLSSWNGLPRDTEQDCPFNRANANESFFTGPPPDHPVQPHSEYRMMPSQRCFQARDVYHTLISFNIPGMLLYNSLGEISVEILPFLGKEIVMVP
jgi:hypothetical protein